MLLFVAGRKRALTSAYGGRLPSDRRVSRTSREAPWMPHPAADPPVLTATLYKPQRRQLTKTGERGYRRGQSAPFRGCAGQCNDGIPSRPSFRRYLYEAVLAVGQRLAYRTAFFASLCFLIVSHALHSCVKTLRLSACPLLRRAPLGLDPSVRYVL